MRASCFYAVVGLVFCELMSKVAVFCAQLDCQTVELSTSYQQFQANKMGCFTVSRDTQQAFLLDTEYSTDFNLTFVDANNSTFWQLPNPAIDKVPFNLMILAPGEGNVTVYYAPVKQFSSIFTAFRLRASFPRWHFGFMGNAVEYLTLGIGQRKVIYSPNYPANRFHLVDNARNLNAIYNVGCATRNSIVQYKILQSSMDTLNYLTISNSNGMILWRTNIHNYFSKQEIGYSGLKIEYILLDPSETLSFAISLEGAVEPSTTTRQPYISTTNKYHSQTSDKSWLNGKWYLFFLVLILPILCIFWICYKMRANTGWYGGWSGRQTGYIATPPVDFSYPVAHGVPAQVYQGAYPPSRNTIEMQPTAPGSNSWPYSTTPSAPPQQSSARSDEPPSYWEAVNAPKPS